MTEGEIHLIKARTLIGSFLYLLNKAHHVTSDGDLNLAIRKNRKTMSKSLYDNYRNARFISGRYRGALVKSHMNSLITFDALLEQTTETMPLTRENNSC